MKKQSLICQQTEILFIDYVQVLFEQKSSTRSGLWRMFLVMPKSEQHQRMEFCNFSYAVNCEVSISRLVFSSVPQLKVISRPLNILLSHIRNLNANLAQNSNFIPSLVNSFLAILGWEALPSQDFTGIQSNLLARVKYLRQDRKNTCTNLLTLLKFFYNENYLKLYKLSPCRVS